MLYINHGQEICIFYHFKYCYLAVMLYFVGIDKIIITLKNANKALIALAIGVQIFTYLLYNLRWKWIINITDIKVSFKQLLPITMVGLAVNNITPSGRGGGEPVRAYILAEEHGSHLKDTLATVVADRMLDTFPLIVLAIITFAATVFYFQMPTWRNRSYFGGDCNRCNLRYSNLLMYQSEFRIQD